MKVSETVITGTRAAAATARDVGGDLSSHLERLSDLLESDEDTQEEVDELVHIITAEALTWEQTVVPLVQAVTRALRQST